MKVKKFRTWRAFEKEMQKELHNRRESQLDATPYDLLFRGQSDANWHLETTLERSGMQNVSVEYYFSMIHKIRNQIETFIGKKWTVPSLENLRKWVDNHMAIEDNFRMNEFPSYEYMAYLRHHGFPSPLLDWSTSPFVAAYFAFRDVASNAKSISIFSYKQGSIEKHFYYQVMDIPKILILEKGVRANKRHYLQKSEYTVCIRRTDKSLFYVSHEDAFTGDMKDLGITKYILPSSERLKALRGLENYNRLLA